MVRRRQHERSLFEVLLPDADKLWPEWLKRIDTWLEDETVIDTVAPSSSGGRRAARGGARARRPRWCFGC